MVWRGKEITALAISHKYHTYHTCEISSCDVPSSVANDDTPVFVDKDDDATPLPCPPCGDDDEAAEDCSAAAAASWSFPLPPPCPLYPRSRWMVLAWTSGWSTTSWRRWAARPEMITRCMDMSMAVIRADSR